MTCAWIETSSAETGSSQTISFGAHRERAGDADALALAARELVRVAAHVVGVQAHRLEQVDDAGLVLAPASSASRWIVSASPMMAPTVMRGLSEA